MRFPRNSSNFFIFYIFCDALKMQNSFIIAAATNNFTFRIFIINFEIIITFLLHIIKDNKWNFVYFNIN